MTEQPRTDREQWAEAEAVQFEKNAHALEECIEGWLKNPLWYENTRRASEIAIRVQTWREAARSLRQPYYARTERGYGE